MQAIEICWPITVTRRALTPTSPIMLGLVRLFVVRAARDRSKQLRPKVVEHRARIRS